MGVNMKISIDEGKQKVVHMNRCKAYHPPTEVYIPVQTMEIRLSINTENSQTSDIVETYSKKTQVQENLPTSLIYCSIYYATEDSPITLLYSRSLIVYCATSHMYCQRIMLQTKSHYIPLLKIVASILC